MTLIVPKDFKGTTYNIDIIQQNEWFSLLKLRSSNFLLAALSKDLFVIVIESNPRKIIAEDDNLDRIILEWDWVQENMTKYLINDDLMRDDLMLLLLGKIEALVTVKNQEQKVEKDNKTFNKQFRYDDHVIICMYLVIEIFKFSIISYKQLNVRCGEGLLGSFLESYM